MTYNELIKNIEKSNHSSSNFMKEVYRRAYSDMVKQHLYCDELKALKEKYKAKGIIAGYTMVYNQYTDKLVRFTIYTKIPKYRTYRQQVAVTAALLEKELISEMKTRLTMKGGEIC